MSTGLSISGGIMPILGSGSTSQLLQGSKERQIQQVSRAVEGIFVQQLVQEMTAGLGTDSGGGGGGFQDVVQQAVTQQVTSGAGIGLAKFVEDYLHRLPQEAAATKSTYETHDHA